MRVPHEKRVKLSGTRQFPWPRYFVAGLLVCCAVAGLRFTMRTVPAGQVEPNGHEQARVTSSQQTSRDDSSRSADHFTVTIHRPSGPPRVDTGLKDLHGKPVSVTCSTCHVARQPNPANQTAKDLDEFHGELNIAHGNVSCLSCHNEGDYDALKLADGTRVEFVDVMTLCAQCHGPQMTAYEHGVHGGKTGYWDLSRGPQMKNNCVDCHHPHTPQFPKMQPTFKPRDRFLEPSRTDH